MKKNLYIIAIIVIFLSIILHSTPGILVRYDNGSKSSDQITITYPAESFSALKSCIERKQYTYWDLLKDFKVECVRKTYQGFYAIFLQENSEHVYVFMDKKLLVYDVLILDSFFSLHDFDMVTKEEESTSISDILSLDVNSVSVPLAMYIQTAHIVQEGVVYVSYSSVKEGMFLSDPIAVNVEFRSNDYLMNHQDELIAQCVPFVLSIDKIT